MSARIYPATLPTPEPGEAFGNYLYRVSQLAGVDDCSVFMGAAGGRFLETWRPYFELMERISRVPGKRIRRR